MALYIANYQVPQGESELLSSRVSLRVPKGDESVRVHASWRAPAVAMVRHSSKFFVVDPALRPVLAGHWFTAELRVGVSSQGELFVWPVRDADGTSKEAADTAVSSWVKLTWNTKGKDYAIEAGGEHGDPKWSDAKFDDLLEAAINDRILANAEDEVVKAIRKKKVRVKTKAKEKKKEETAVKAK